MIERRTRDHDGFWSLKRLSHRPFSARSLLPGDLVVDSRSARRGLVIVVGGESRGEWALVMWNSEHRLNTDTLVW